MQKGKLLQKMQNVSQLLHAMQEVIKKNLLKILRKKKSTDTFGQGPLANFISSDMKPKQQQEQTGKSNGKDLTSGESNGKDLTSGESNGKDLTSGESNGKDLTSGESHGKDLTSGESNGKDLTSGESNGKDLTSSESNGKDLTSGESNGKDLTSDVSNGKELKSCDKTHQKTVSKDIKPELPPHEESNQSTYVSQNQKVSDDVTVPEETTKEIGKEFTIKTVSKLQRVVSETEQEMSLHDILSHLHSMGEEDEESDCQKTEKVNLAKVI